MTPLVLYLCSTWCVYTYIKLDCRALLGRPRVSCVRCVCVPEHSSFPVQHLHHINTPTSVHECVSHAFDCMCVYTQVSLWITPHTSSCVWVCACVCFSSCSKWIWHFCFPFSFSITSLTHRGWWQEYISFSSYAVLKLFFSQPIPLNVCVCVYLCLPLCVWYVSFVFVCVAQSLTHPLL